MRPSILLCTVCSGLRNLGTQRCQDMAVTQRGTVLWKGGREARGTQRTLKQLTLWAAISKAQL